MRLVARLIRLTAEDPVANADLCRTEVAELCLKHPLYK